MGRLALAGLVLTLGCAIPLGSSGWTLKPGVELGCARAELLDAIDDVEEVMLAGRWGPLVVTSICEGVHMRESRHYRGLAFDIRVRVHPYEKRVELAGVIRRKLGPGSKVLLEDTHLHVALLERRGRIHVRRQP